MKKKRALRILSLILLCVLALTACKKNVGTPEDNAASKDENTEEKDKDEQESWKIGFSGIDMQNPYFITLESAIKEELDGKNCELIDLSFIGWGLLAGITCGIAGVFYVTPYIYATNTELYAFNKVQAYNEGYIR